MNTYEIIVNRRTIRKFSQKPISDDLLIKYINAARLAPSAANRQPLKYKPVNDKTTVNKILKFVKWANYISPAGNPAEGEEPTAFIAVVADTDIRKDGYETDMGAAVQNMIITAESDGIGSCWMGAIDYKEITKILNLPENLKLLCVVALGYKAEYPRECPVVNNDIKYYKDEYGILNVPKRSLSEVIVK